MESCFQSIGASSFISPSLLINAEFKLVSVTHATPSHASRSKVCAPGRRYTCRVGLVHQFRIPSKQNPWMGMYSDYEARSRLHRAVTEVRKQKCFRAQPGAGPKNSQP